MTGNYEDKIAELSNLKLFSQFVFIVLKVLTFDENRDCLFWNQSVLTPTLFLCMGTNVEDAERADDLSRKISKHNSRARNFKWEITKQTNRLTTLIEEKRKAEATAPDGKEEEANITNQYEELLVKIDKMQNDYDSYLDEKRKLYSDLTELAVNRVELEKQYSNLYSQLFQSKVAIKEHPLLIQITEDACPICGTKHEVLPQNICDCLERNICPLCLSEISEMTTESTDIITELSKVDSKLKDVMGQLDEKTKRNEFLEQKITETNNLSIQLNEEKSKFDQQFFFILNRKDASSSWDNRISALRDAIAEVEKDRAEAIRVRDELKLEYDKLCVDYNAPQS